MDSEKLNSVLNYPLSSIPYPLFFLFHPFDLQLHSFERDAHPAAVGGDLGDAIGRHLATGNEHGADLLLDADFGQGTITGKDAQATHALAGVKSKYGYR